MSAKGMPFLMPDGSRLSTLLDRAEPKRAKHKSRQGSKQPAKHRMDVLFEARDEHDAVELAAVAKLGARSKLRCRASAKLDARQKASTLAWHMGPARPIGRHARPRVTITRAVRRAGGSTSACCARWRAP